ncbi:RsmB/NOP family class I SAM-dependent RNA methyltransferase [Ponticaulis sp.]|uniref:RsmB/NOP family class I SAM-dependent RNA methyltransferase n=1 Tax=Ponticaulis sp. TaxID=2020902 RepID=UPI0026322510|nr:RsmB/NOP family class I SAM-dependent RNA methyltransferase [Ponticaulis sp.]MDF1680014.1 RsmB/NOP family class I SAM-dependent RNA methyltransferase [Ponticaulis sp.]
MKNGGRIEAAIQVLDDVMNRHQPVKSAMRDWGKRARYAGAKDRAWVSGLVLDALRHRNSLAYAMQSEAPRVLVLGALRHVWDWDMKDIESALKDEHAPSPLTGEEREGILLAPDPSAPLHVRGDFPEWLTPHLTRVFGEDTVIETQEMSVRAPVDLRINTLKADPEKAGKAVKTAGGKPSDLLVNGYHIPAPDPSQRETSLQSIPAYSKGWVEVQDAGSQIAAAAGNAKPGDNVLDFCAGGGGKTLALAAMMEGKGQVFAYDIDGRRLSALIPRLKRSGAHNVQLCHPKEPEALEALTGKMDLVFVDAPCTGTGTWRRKPDTKWRLKESALAKRNEEQAMILDKASEFVKPGGRLLYATCSFLAEEDEDQVTAFLERNDAFRQLDAVQNVIESGQLTDAGIDIVRRNQIPGGAVRLTPRKAGTDGFFFAVLEKKA